MAITKNKPAKGEFWVGSEVKKENRMAENRAEVVFLGTGTSVGVPALGCDCEVCTGGKPSNQRTRCSIVVRNSRGNLLVDTPPDLRTQLLREKIGVVHEVLSPTSMLITFLGSMILGYSLSSRASCALTLRAKG